MYLGKKYIGIFQIVLGTIGLFVFIFCGGCRNSSSSFHPDRELSRLIQTYYSSGDTIPLADTILQTFLPIHLPGYPHTEANGKTFRSPNAHFSFAEKIYHGRQRLSISIGDYVGDSLTYLSFWQQYQTQKSSSSSNTFFDEQPFVFGWMETDPLRQTTTRYAALKGRYFIEIKTNNIRQTVSPQNQLKEIRKVYKTLEETVFEKIDRTREGEI